MEKSIIVIRTGYKYRGENWDDFVDGYFGDIVSAERYLKDNGYEYSHDDVYSMVDDEEITRYARIESLYEIKFKKQKSITEEYQIHVNNHFGEILITEEMANIIANAPVKKIESNLNYVDVSKLNKDEQDKIITKLLKGGS